jgi:hypothetical protein
MRYTFNGEPVQLEQWRWTAVFQDGTILEQFDESTGLFHQFKEIDQSKLATFHMSDGINKYTLLFNPDAMKLIHYYKKYHLDVGGTDTKLTLYVFGYEVKGHKVLNVITPTGEVITTDSVENLNVA